MKLIYFLAVAVALALTSCAEGGLKLGNFSLTTPYGEISSDKDGNISGGIVIPQKSGK